MNKRVLITGASGYLGSHVCKAMKQDGWSVHGFDSKHTTNRYIDVMSYGDIRDRISLDQLFSTWQFDLVIHLAARIEAGISVKEPTDFYDVNTGGTCALVNAMDKVGLKDIIFASTAAVYTAKDSPILETDETTYNSPYGHSKKMAEEVIQKSKLNYAIFRFFNLTGADPDGEFGEEHEPETHLIPRLIMSIDGGFEMNGDDYNTKDGTCIRDYVHVSDVAEAILDAAHHLSGGGESDIFNLGIGHGYTIKEVIEELERVSGKKIEYKINPRREGDAASLMADISKAQRVLKYTPKYDLTSIINTAYEWHTHDEKETTTT